MMDELLESKKISQSDYDMYVLFQTNDLGRKCYQRMVDETFMDEPINKEFRGEGFAFYDGRRSVFRDIRRAIDRVTNILKEENYVG